MHVYFKYNDTPNRSVGCNGEGLVLIRMIKKIPTGRNRVIIIIVVIVLAVLLLLIFALGLRVRVDLSGTQSCTVFDLDGAHGQKMLPVCGYNGVVS